MSLQPEDIKDEETEEIVGEDEKRSGDAELWKGFFLGFLIALVCVCIFLVGWTTAQRVRLRRQNRPDQDQSGQDQSEGVQEQDPGAGILTDDRTLAKIGEMENLIEQHYLGDVDSDLLSEYLFKGIAYGIGDDYSDYYAPPEYESVMDDLRGTYQGIGITVEEDTQTQAFYVTEVYEGSPAQEAGIEVGDDLLEIDGTSVEGMSLSEVVDLIKSQEGTFLLKVWRPETSEEMELELQCGEVEAVSVEYAMLDDEIGYIWLESFTLSAIGQFQEALEDMDAEGMKKLIVDLRDNPGGRLDSALGILDEILPEGLIVYTEDKAGEREEYRSDEEQVVSCEIAVLVNGGSASASEIFAGAVQDYGLGPVVGTQTYGKGVVQDTYTLSDGSAFRLTTKKYCTPNGQEIDGNGITPDIVVEDVPPEAGEDEEGYIDMENDAVLAKALEALEQE